MTPIQELDDTQMRAFLHLADWLPLQLLPVLSLSKGAVSDVDGGWQEISYFASEELAHTKIQSHKDGFFQRLAFLWRGERGAWVGENAV